MDVAVLVVWTSSNQIFFCQASMADATSPSGEGWKMKNDLELLWDITDPIDEGLWTGVATNYKSTNNSGDDDDDELEEENVTVDEKFRSLRNALRLAEIDSMRFLSKTPLPKDVMRPMTYTIFESGQSALRSIIDDKKNDDRHLLFPESLFGLSKSGTTGITSDTHSAAESAQPHKRLPQFPSACHYRVCAALMLLRGHADVAHELLLGVTPHNLEEAEYAATHRGKTTWAQDHPLTDEADHLHAAMHRIVEGDALGEGNATGYENAQYWLAGGPKLLDAPASTQVRQSLARIALAHCPKCVQYGDVIACNEGAEHTVLSGGGTYRTVRVPAGQFDDFAFLKLCQQWARGELTDATEEWHDEMATLQRAEIILLLRHASMECLGLVLEQEHAAAEQ